MNVARRLMLRAPSRPRKRSPPLRPGTPRTTAALNDPFGSRARVAALAADASTVWHFRAQCNRRAQPASLGLTPLTPLRAAPLWGFACHDSPTHCAKAERRDEGLRTRP